MKITDEMIEAAKAKGRELAGSQPGSLVEAMAEIAVEGAKAALAVAPTEIELMREALRRLVEAYHDMQDGNGDPCPDVAFAREVLDGKHGNV